MFGLGPTELFIIAVICGLLLLVPLLAIVVIVRMTTTGRLEGPKNCPHCGADLRAPSKQHGQPV